MTGRMVLSSSFRLNYAFAPDDLYLRGVWQETMLGMSQMKLKIGPGAMF